MYTRLNKYTNFGFFTFLPLPTRKNCFQKCNAPANMSGVYLIYGIGFEKEELVYIGSSGKKTPEGKIKVRKGGAGMTGIKGRLIQGSQKGIPRYKLWKENMLVDGFKRLRINWYVTHDIDFVDCPMELETELIKRWNPRWNIRQVEPPNKKL